MSEREACMVTLDWTYPEQPRLVVDLRRTEGGEPERVEVTGPAAMGLIHDARVLIRKAAAAAERTLRPSPAPTLDAEAARG